jgi:hypothetical protein
VVRRALAVAVIVALGVTLAGCEDPAPTNGDAKVTREFKQKNTGKTCYRIKLKKRSIDEWQKCLDTDKYDVGDTWRG